MSKGISHCISTVNILHFCQFNPFCTLPYPFPPTPRYSTAFNTYRYILFLHRCNVFRNCWPPFSFHFLPPPKIALHIYTKHLVRTLKENKIFPYYGLILMPDFKILLHEPLLTLIFLFHRYGMNCLIQFEDFANVNAFRLLNKYRNKYCTFNDDIQGTASVAVAGLLAALRITKNKLSDQTVLFQGAGEAALGIAHLIVMAMEKEGLPKEKAIKKIWLVDSKGLIVKGRASLTQEKKEFAHEHEEMKNLEAIVQKIKPTALIGVAAIGGAFSEQILKDMAAFNERPIIFALSNPTSKAECSAEQCYKISKGRAVFASGSPFDPVTLPNGRTLYPGQGNNSYVFPGVALGVVACGLRHITDKIFLTTAEVISQQVSDEHLEEGRLYPPLNTIRDVSLKIAIKIVNDAYQEKTATVYPEPQNKEAFVRAQMYSTDYDQILPDCYSWPEEVQKIQTRADD
uniref:Malic enzyme NAD-binding domain-containing protein n=2 Tax=Castor canadensis TaxID=51338 RepID=A0A8C0ZWV3_CASCN